MVKRVRDVADPNSVPLFQCRGASDQSIVQVGPVAAAHVLEAVLPVGKPDPRMIPADGAGLDHDVALRVPSQHGFQSGKLELVPLLWAVDRQ